ncbi:MAG: class I SAM-dependent methyltransferase [bacterium]|nr:class I SAM-dependent methyltransferase [bacterium]
MASEDRFGFEWQKFSWIAPEYEIQFRRWIAPLAPADFSGKVVLDAGCGMGRNSFWALKWGAKEVVAFDNDSRSVESARKNLSVFPNVRVVFKSIYEIDWTNYFDLVFSIGVTHHLKEPKKALANLVKSLKEGGRLVLWVYSYEGSEWIVKFISPFRKKITSKLPVRLVYFLSYFFSVPLWIFVKIFKGPTPYLKQLSSFKFWHIHSIVFDQLIPEVANYWRKKEVEDLVSSFGLKDIKIFRPENGIGWTVIGYK